MGAEQYREPGDAKYKNEMPTFEAFTFLGGSKDQRDEARAEFLAAEVDRDNPELGLAIDVDKRRRVEEDLLALKENISKDKEIDDLVQKVLLKNINSKVIENRMLIAAAEGNMRHWRKLGEVTYGQVDAEVLAFGIGRAKALASEIQENALGKYDEQAVGIAKRLQGELPTEVYDRNWPSSALRGLRNVIRSGDAYTDTGVKIEGGGYDEKGNKVEGVGFGKLGNEVLEMVGSMKFKPEFDESGNLVVPESTTEEYWEMVEAIRELCIQYAGDPLVKSIQSGLPEKIKVETVMFEGPKTETLTAMHGILRERYEGLFELVDMEKKYSPEEAAVVLREALKVLGYDKKWTVVVNYETGARNMSVDQEKTLVSVPGDPIERQMLLNRENGVDSVAVDESKRKYYKAGSVLGLEMHELGKHVVSREEGMKGEMAQLGIGIYPDYESGEEGFAGAIQTAALNEEFEWGYLDRHMAIGLAAGLDGKRRDFSEVFEIMKDYYYLEAVKEGDTHEEALSWAAGFAYMRCERTFRGGSAAREDGATNDERRPMPFPKDKVYAEGVVDIWALMNKNPDLLKMAFLGKYDPANPLHVETLVELGTWERVAREEGVEGEALLKVLREYWETKGRVQDAVV